MGNKHSSKSSTKIEEAVNTAKQDENGIEIGLFLPNEIVELILSYLENEPLGNFTKIEINEKHDVD